MKTLDLKLARERLGLSQLEAAACVGVSQSYLSMLETGTRQVNAKLARKLMRTYGLPPTVLPPSVRPLVVEAQDLAEELAALGYPGFAHLRTRRRMKNPAEVLLAALAQENLEARVVEALPWLLLRYWDMDGKWLADQARLKNLQNRLGYVVSLARRVAQRADADDQQRSQVLLRLEEALEESRLAREDTLCRMLREPERRWVQENRPDEARYWNLLTDLRSENLPYEQ